MREQRRSKAIAMTDDERDEFLREERTCRVATVAADGAPHVTPLWFLWDGTSLWLTSIVKSQRWTDLQRDGRVGVVVDAGEGYMELRGVEIRGRVEVVGEVPRTGEPNAELDVIERLNAAKYTGGQVVHDGRHAWLRVVPDKIVSWDFRKLATLAQNR
jgi:PPOX class probable F420-dependent enzyme